MAFYYKTELLTFQIFLVYHIQLKAQNLSPQHFYTFSLFLECCPLFLGSCTAFQFETQLKYHHFTEAFPSHLMQSKCPDILYHGNLQFSSHLSLSVIVFYLTLLYYVASTPASKFHKGRNLFSFAHCFLLIVRTLNQYRHPVNE